MNVTPEIVRAEMDYRVERALTGAALEHVRAVRRLHRPWYQRLFDHEHTGEASTEVNGPPLAA
ncbi:hypothetical protein [Actinophytocola sp.]|jgi:hypothetical protein|uniref:hypothetical protein n=1 Tax=Actinophytocola sp. TaxID=1872138 RepID=UPI002EDB4CC0